MNDTNKQILALFNADATLSSSQAHKELTDISLVTVKRRLSKLTELGLLVQTGAGRSVRYALSKRGLLLKPINIENYSPRKTNPRHSAMLVANATNTKR